MPTEDVARVAYELLSEADNTKEDVAIMQLCLKELAAILERLCLSWSLRPFGSSANGFSTRCSDLDITCFEESPSGKLAREYIDEIQPLLRQHDSFQVVEVIHGARIPVLKLRFQLKLHVDLSFQNTEPFRNTQLLRAYAQLNPVIRHLGILVKLWAKAEGVCGAQHNHLSSYSLLLMVLYFMQVEESIKMPCFSTSEFTGEKFHPACANISWSCPVQLPSLLSRFFKFYATSHCWGYEVVSPRVGKRVYASDNRFAKLSGRDNSATILIEDPFFLSRNLNCVLGQAEQDLLYGKICQANADLESGSIPGGFMQALQMQRCRNGRVAFQMDVKGAMSPGEVSLEFMKAAVQSNIQENTQSLADTNTLSLNVNLGLKERRCDSLEIRDAKNNSRFKSMHVNVEAGPDPKKPQEKVPKDHWKMCTIQNKCEECTTSRASTDCLSSNDGDGEIAVSAPSPEEVPFTRLPFCAPCEDLAGILTFKCGCSHSVSSIEHKDVRQGKSSFLTMHDTCPSCLPVCSRYVRSRTCVPSCAFSHDRDDITKVKNQRALDKLLAYIAPRFDPCKHLPLLNEYPVWIFEALQELPPMQKTFVLLVELWGKGMQRKLTLASAPNALVPLALHYAQRQTVVKFLAQHLQGFFLWLASLQGTYAKWFGSAGPFPGNQCFVEQNLYQLHREQRWISIFTDARYAQRLLSPFIDGRSFQEKLIRRLFK